MTEQNLPERDLPIDSESTERETNEKKPAGLLRFWRWFCGKNPDGSTPKPVVQSKKRTFLRYVAVILAFFAIAGLATAAYQIPKIAEEGGVQIPWLETLFSEDKTDEELAYDKIATHPSAFAYRVKEDGTVAL